AVPLSQCETNPNLLWWVRGEFVTCRHPWRNATVKSPVSEDSKMAPPRPSEEWAPATRFYRQLSVTTMSVVLVVGVVYLLDRFATILQQLLVAGFIAYIILPIHYWLERRGLRSSLAYVLILLAFFGFCAVIGVAIQSSFQDLNEKLPTYKRNFT